MTSSLLLPKIIHWEKDPREAEEIILTPWIPELACFLSPLVERVTYGVLGYLNSPIIFRFLDKNFDIKTATIIFLFSSFKVAAKLGACLPSFPPGGKLCGWVINTLMDPAGTVSCNLICKEIIWVIDREKRLLLDNSTLSLALQKTFKNFLP